MIGDRELLAFRQGYYEILVSFFLKEPTGGLLASLSDGIGERIEAARNLHPLLAEGWKELQRFFSETPAEELAEAGADEYTRLFIGPYDPTVNPYESFYFTGRMWDKPLANLRTFLKIIGIERQEGYSEPEDSLAFELEVMRWLIGKQQGAADSDDEARWLRLQADFLKNHLLIWAPTCCQEIESAQWAKLYRGVAMILRAFLEMERGLFRDWGVEPVPPLEEVRRLHMAIPMWKGPTFEEGLPDQGGEHTPPVDKKG
jgi:TorA maturation chaperone TorD